MTLSATVAPHLPYLRRFARALTGEPGQWRRLCGGHAGKPDRRTGDPEIHLDPKIALYQTLSRLWGSVPINGKSEVPQPSWEVTVQGRLSSLPGPARQVFLLSAVEGLENRDIAEVIQKKRGRRGTALRRCEPADI